MVCVGSSSYRAVSSYRGSHQFCPGGFYGNADWPSHWINLLLHSSLITYYNKYRNRFNFSSSLLHVLLCRALSLFRCIGSSERWTSSVQHAPEHAYLYEPDSGVNVWTNIVFVLIGLIFLLIGLQLPSITQQLGDISIGRAIWYGLSVSFVLIITRLLCTLGTSLFTRFMSYFITVADTNPGWKMPFIYGWPGMRGVVSLAAALSIPLLITRDIHFRIAI